MKFPLRLLPAVLMLPFASAKPPADVQARLDEFVKGKPGGIAVAWVDGDGPVFFNAGKFSADDTRPITADTQFEIGSLTKTLTSLLLAESERLGRVCRSDSVAKYLLPPGDPDAAKLEKITLLALATHRSGLPRLPRDFSVKKQDRANPYATLTRADLVASLRLEGPAAKPDGEVAYSNFGVSLLGEALGAAWGTSYDAALREHVLKPLGLNHTTVGLPGSNPAGDLAGGHAEGGPVANWEFDAYAPCGAVRSSTRDLAKLVQAALGGDGTPLHATWMEVIKPIHRAVKDGGSIGLAWFLIGDPAKPLVSHNGQTGGYHSYVAFSRFTGAGIVVLTNHNDSIDALGLALLLTHSAQATPGLHPPKPLPARKVVTLPPETLREYVGEYPLTPQFVLAITEADGALFVQATGQGKLRVTPTAKDEFLQEAAEARLSFERDAEGKVVAVILHQGRDSRGEKRR